MTVSTIAIVIPVLGDAPPLANLLERIRRWQDSNLELIVVSGDDDPIPAELAQTHGARYLTTQPCRGAQLDLGARASAADILWFLHADAAPQDGACAAIRQAVNRGAIGGYFRFRFQGPATLTKILLSAGINLRARFGVPYGDQGLFATRSAYEQAGGYPHQPLFEEVTLVRALRHRGRFDAVPVVIGVDPRRWERDGWIKRTLRNRWLAVRYALGAAPVRLAAHYPRQENSHG